MATSGMPAATEVMTGVGLGCRLGGGAGATATVVLCPTMTRGLPSSPMEWEGGAAGEDPTDDMSASKVRSTCMCSATVI